MSLGCAWGIAFASPACSLIELPNSGTAVGGAGGTANGGAMPAECSTPDECPGVDDDCQQRTCDAVCGVQLSPAGTLCAQDGGDICDGAGDCVKSDGQACTSPTECLSAFCTDNVCCDAPCDDICMGCDVAGSVGTCTYQPAATDPDNDCDGGTCDGRGWCASGTYAASLNAEPSRPVAVAVDSTDSILVAGIFSANITIGGQLLTHSGSGQDAMIFKLNAARTHLWNYGLSGAGDVEATDIATDSMDNVIVVGHFTGTLSVTTSAAIVTVDAGSTTDAFVMKLNADGAVQWFETFGDGATGTADQRALSVAIGSGDDIIVGGTYGGPFDVGNDTLTTAPTAPANDIFLLKLDPIGTPSIAKGYTGEGNDGIADVATDASGMVYLGGSFDDDLDIDNPPLTAGGSGADLFVAKLDPHSLDRVWAKSWGSSSGDQLIALATHPDGTIAISGWFGTTIDFGGGPNLKHALTSDAFVVKLDTDGVELFNLAPLSVGTTCWYARSDAVAIDAHGNLIASVLFMDSPAGSMPSTVDFGGTPIVSTQTNPNAIGKVSADGTHLWSFELVASDFHGIADLATDSTGRVVVVGSQDGDIQLGPNTYSATDLATYVVTFEP